MMLLRSAPSPSKLGQPRQPRLRKTKLPITSPHNERLKKLKKLSRHRVRSETGLFIAEGEDLVNAAAAAGWNAVELYCAAGSGLPGTEVLPDVLAQVSQLGSGTRTIGVYEQRWSRPAGRLCMAAYDLHDPGNVGTIIRSAQAFSAASVALGPGCADPYGHKAVRAAMGALFEVPLARFSNVGELPGKRIALVVCDGIPLAEADLTGEITLLVGGERQGLPPEIIADCDQRVRIPIAGDSLNAAIAAAIALYGATIRQPDPGR
jgi:RNA methyltransferase, TrmH family